MRRQIIIPASSGDGRVVDALSSLLHYNDNIDVYVCKIDQTWNDRIQSQIKIIQATRINNTQSIKIVDGGNAASISEMVNIAYAATAENNAHSVDLCYPSVTICLDGVTSYSNWVDHLYEAVDRNGKDGLYGVMSQLYAGVQQVSRKKHADNDQKTIAAQVYTDSDGITATTCVTGGVLHLTSDLARALRGTGGCLLDQKLLLKGHEDDDLSVRTIDAGFGVYVARSAYIFDSGSLFVSEVHNAMNWQVLLDKHHHQRSGLSMCLIHRVKIEREEDIRMLSASCQNVHPLFDKHIVVIDNQSLPMRGKIIDLFNKIKIKAEICVDDDCLSPAILEKTTSQDWCMLLNGDEILPPHIDYMELQRLMYNPDPTTTAYTANILVMWDSTSMCRTDALWGDISQIRLWKTNNTEWITAESDMICTYPSSAPVQLTTIDANIQIQTLAYLHTWQRIRAYHESNSKYKVEFLRTEDMKYRCLTSELTVGVTMLAYSEEDMLGYAQWFRLLYGMCKHKVLVWTDTKKPKKEIIELCKVYGVEIIKHKLNNHISEARNVGIDRLSDLGCDWACFFDPDEVIPNPSPHIKEIRNAIQHTMSWGYLFTYINEMIDLHGESVRTKSESIRLFRLRNGVMRLNGRVHEGFDRAIEELGANGVHPHLLKFKYPVWHNGLMKSGNEIDKKLLKYRNLLMLDVMEDPSRCSSWVSLALQYHNDDRPQQARVCFERAVSVAGDSYLPYKEYGLRKLNIAIGLLKDCYGRMGGEWDIKPHLENLFAAAEPLVKDPKIKSGGLDEVDIPEPDFEFHARERL